VECQVSFRPVSYISAASAKKRDAITLEAGVAEWVEKKFTSPRKKEMRERCWPDLTWRYKFVHGVVRDQTELDFIKARWVKLISFEQVLHELCGHKPGELFGGAGTDIAEMIRYYADFSTRRS
jgi:hypothetical protein